MDLTLANLGIPLEKQIETFLCESLREINYNVRRQVKCSGGKADIVTDDYVIEVKRELNNNSIKGAMGQVLLYADELHKKPVLAGYPGNCDQHLVNLVRSKGISFLIRDQLIWNFYL